MTNAHVEIIEEQKKENKVVVMPVRFLNLNKKPIQLQIVWVSKK